MQGVCYALLFGFVCFLGVCLFSGMGWWVSLGEQFTDKGSVKSATLVDHSSHSFPSLPFLLYVFYLHVCLCTICVWCLQRPEEGVRSPGPRVRVLSHCLGPGNETQSFWRSIHSLLTQSLAPSQSGICFQ